MCPCRWRAWSDVQVIRIDGSRRKLAAAGTGITLSITTDPLLLLYDGGDKELPAKLDAPLATIDSLVATGAARSAPLHLGMHAAQHATIAAVRT